MKYIVSLLVLLVVSTSLSCGRPSSVDAASTARPVLVTVQPTVRNNCRAMKILVRILTEVAFEKRHHTAGR